MKKSRMKQVLTSAAQVSRIHNMRMKTCDFEMTQNRRFFIGKTGKKEYNKGYKGQNKGGIL